MEISDFAEKHSRHAAYQSADQQFIDSVNSMLSGLESLEVHMDKLQAAMTSWGPCTPEDFKQKLAQWVDSQISGKDKSKVRIVIK